MTYNAEITVDVTAENASVAREKAMTEANRQAYTAVAKRVTTADGVRRLNELNDAQILNFIKEVSIISEKASNVRYIATLNVAVNEHILKTYMQENDIPFVIGSVANILIIPTFREFKTDAPMLWEADNLWRKAWEQNPRAIGSVRFFSIPANGSNYAALDAEKALRMDGMALDKIAFINNTKDIYVADAVYNGIEGLNVTLYSYRDGREESVSVPGDRSPQLFIDAINQISDHIYNQIKKQNVVDRQSKSEITVLYSYAYLRDWLMLEKQLKEIGYVNGISTAAVGSGKVQFKITYIGGFDKLLEALRSKYYNLKSTGDFYIIEKSEKGNDHADYPQKQPQHDVLADFVCPVLHRRLRAAFGAAALCRRHCHWLPARSLCLPFRKMGHEPHASHLPGTVSGRHNRSAGNGSAHRRHR